MNYINAENFVKQMINIENFVSETSIDTQRNEIIKGLTAEKKYISSKFFYDKKGSELFEEITKLDEYYPTRTEKLILSENAKTIIKDLPDSTIIELGSGDSSKISLLLNSMNETQIKSVIYCPFDVSRTAVEKSANNLSLVFPSLKIHAFIADFTVQLNRIPESNNKIICFFGSTVGNLKRSDASDFIKKISKIMNPGDTFLLGTDMVKDVKILEDAYNDKLGITAAFNKNILNVVNGILKTDFNPDLFKHIAFYNKEKARIEMHLQAVQNMEINSSYLPSYIRIKENECIHTENSHKFTEKNIYDFADFAGLTVKNIFRDKNHFFSVTQFIK